MTDMTFGEKIKTLRSQKKMSQTDLAKSIGVSLRTIRGWEELYNKLSNSLGCDVSYLMSDEENFITTAAEQYGSRGAKQAQAILEQTAALFAGGDLSDTDQIAFLNEIQSLYLDSKKRAKKFTPKKYLKQEKNEDDKE